MGPLTKVLSSMLPVLGKILPILGIIAGGIALGIATKEYVGDPLAEAWERNSAEKKEKEDEETKRQMGLVKTDNFKRSGTSQSAAFKLKSFQSKYKSGLISEIISLGASSDEESKQMHNMSIEELEKKLRRSSFIEAEHPYLRGRMTPKTTLEISNQYISQGQLIQQKLEEQLKKELEQKRIVPNTETKIAQPVDPQFMQLMRDLNDNMKAMANANRSNSLITIPSPPIQNYVERRY
jgi:hypothetical protein